MTDRTINWVLRATDKTDAAFRSVDSKLAGITKSLRTFAGFAGFAAVATGLSSLTSSLVEMGSELQDASDKLGVSAETLQVLKFAAEQTGSSFDSLQSALVFNAKLTANAARGNKEASDALRLLGISADTFVKVPLDRRLSVIAERLARVKDPAAQVDLAVKVLGRSAADLVPLLSQGAAGIKKFEEQLRASNSILGDDQAKALADAGDAWEKFLLRLKVGAAGPFTTAIGWIDRLLTKIDDLDRAIKEREREKLFDAGKIPADLLQKGPPQRDSRRNAPYDPSGMTEALNTFGPAAFRSSSEGQSVSSRLKVQFDEVNAAADKSAATIARAQAAYNAELARTEELQAAVAAGIADLGKQSNAYFTDRGQELTERYKPALTTLTDGILEVNRLFAAGAISSDVANAAVHDYADTYQQSLDAVKDKNVEVKDSTTAMLESLKLSTDGFARDLTDAFFDATNSIGEYFENLAVTIAKALFTKSVSEPLIKGILGSLGTSLDLGRLFGGARAMGGPVSAGSAYLVGERGPELFVPGAGGRIVPNSDAGGQNPISVNLTITSVDPQTAAQTIAQQERLITGMIRRASMRAGVRPQLA